MIEGKKQDAALRAVHAVVIKGRTLAYENAPHRSIARLLDGVEYLPALIYDPEDLTDTFRTYLEEVAEEVNCIRALELFGQCASEEVPGAKLLMRGADDAGTENEHDLDP